MNRSGLKKVTKSVRGKHGSVRRSYWIKAQESAKNVGQKIWRNKGKIAIGVGLAAGAFQFSKWVKGERDTVRRTPPNAAFGGHAHEHVGWGFAKKLAVDEHNRRAQTTPTMKKNGWSPERLSARQADHSAPAELGSGVNYKPAKPKRSRKKK